MPDFPDDIKSRIQELEYRVESEPSPEVFSELADLYRTSENIDRAKTICKKGLELFPDNHDCLLTYARILMDESRLEEAEVTLKKLLDISGEDVGILLLLGQLYTQRDDFTGVKFVAERLSKNFSDDVRAKKFLKFLESKGLLKGQETPQSTVQKDVNGSGTEGRAESKKTTATDVQQFQKKRTKINIPPLEKGPIVPIEDLMHISALLKGIVGVKHVVLLTPNDKTFASKGCPENTARSLGLLLRSFKKALLIAFTSLNFGKWKKGVMELENSTIHIIESNSHLFALVCDEKVSLGALRIAVNTILSKYFHI